MAAMAMLALEASNRPKVIRIKVCCATIHPVCVFLYSGTGYAVLALAERFLVKTTIP